MRREPNRAEREGEYDHPGAESERLDLMEPAGHDIVRRGRDD